MTGGSPWKHILGFSWPVFAGSVLQQLYNTADSVIVGNFSGEKALSAVGTTNTLIFFFLAIAIGVSAGNGVLAAQHFGSGHSYYRSWRAQRCREDVLRENVQNDYTAAAEKHGNQQQSER